MNLLDDLALMAIVQVEEIFLWILRLVNKAFVEPLDGQFDMLLAADETENVVDNRAFDALVQIVFGHNQQKLFEQLLLALGHFIQGEIVGAQLFQVAQSCSDVLLHRLLGQVVHDELEVMQGAHFAVDHVEPELIPDDASF